MITATLATGSPNQGTRLRLRASFAVGGQVMCASVCETCGRRRANHLDGRLLLHDVPMGSQSNAPAAALRSKPKASSWRSKRAVQTKDSSWATQANRLRTSPLNRNRTSPLTILSTLPTILVLETATAGGQDRAETLNVGFGESGDHRQQFVRLDRLGEMHLIARLHGSNPILRSGISRQRDCRGRTHVGVQCPHIPH